MAYDIKLAEKVRDYLTQFTNLQVKEKKMFGGLAFMVNDKMCINIGNKQLMCRFEPELTEQTSQRAGFLPMVMKGKEYRGYCYVEPIGYENKNDFEYWMKLCLDFNDKAMSSKKIKASPGNAISSARSKSISPSTTTE